jgi:hypothetical protein
MVEVGIVVQLRDVTADGKKGRCAVGYSKFQTGTATPQKSWARYFEDASRRALTNRHALIEGNHLAAPAPEQLHLSLQNQNPAPRRRVSRPKIADRIHGGPAKEALEQNRVHASQASDTDPLQQALAATHARMTEKKGGPAQ